MPTTTVKVYSDRWVPVWTTFGRGFSVVFGSPDEPFQFQMQRTQGGFVRERRTTNAMAVWWYQAIPWGSVTVKLVSGGPRDVTFNINSR